jgi:hypothetical protein
METPADDFADFQAPEMAASGLAAPAAFSGEEAPLMGHVSAILAIPDVGHTPEALPAWLAGADAEERRELEDLGVMQSPEFKQEAERDALISRLMQVSHEYDADVARFDAAEQLEHKAITARYDRLRAPSLRQLSRLASYIMHLVAGASFTGKKKSRTVGWGSYGHRKERDKVDVVNLPDAVAYVRKVAPDRVTVEVKTNARVVDAVEEVVSALLLRSPARRSG